MDTKQQSVVKQALAQVHEVEKTKVDDESLERERERQKLYQESERFKAELEDRQLDRELKKNIARQVFTFLAAETGLVLLIVALHGFGWRGFKLEEWSLNIFVTATIAQISAMAVIITKHLFPTK